jgi:hypothetical protein
MAVDAFPPSYRELSRGGIGHELALLRLTHRERRLVRAIEALRRRVDTYAARGEAVPGPLNEALAGFSTDLADVRREIGADRLSPGRGDRRRQT